MYTDTENEHDLRTLIFQADDRGELLVEVPEWNTHILVKQLSGLARAEYFSFHLALEQNNQKNSPDYFKRLWFELARLGCMHPKTKNPVFKVADRDTLMNEHNGAVIETLGRTVQVFSKLDGTMTALIAKNLLGILSSSTTTSSSNDSDKTTGE